jgi:hypothetical protein
MNITIKPTPTAKQGITYTIVDRTGTDYDLDLFSMIRTDLRKYGVFTSCDNNVITPINKTLSTNAWGGVDKTITKFFGLFNLDVTFSMDSNGTYYTITNPNRASRSSRAYRFRA